VQMKMMLAGKACDAANGAVLEVVNPADMRVIDTVPVATKEDVENALDAAREGFERWRKVPLYRRIEIFYTFSRILLERKEEYAKILCDSSGKTYASCLGAANGTAQLFRFYGEKARNFGGMSFPLDSEPVFSGDMAFTIREPLGVIACVIPFNYPGELYAHKVAPALIMGNSVLVKPSSDTPLDNILLTEMLIEAGVDPLAVQCITGRGEDAGEWLSNSPKIDAISLTGSTAVGIAIASGAAKNLAHAHLELGGNDAMIICDDADLELAVAETVGGRLSNSGQTCCAPKRFFVDNKIKDRYVEMLIEAFKKIKTGNPYDADIYYGPLVSEKAAVKVEEQVQKTISQGAKCVFGGKRFNHTYFEPTILIGVTETMDIALNMEVFGPVVPVIGFDTLEDALRMTNACANGLQGGIITRDMKKALKASTEMECGTVVINGSGNYRFDHQPFGGHKMSGIGHEGVSQTLEELSQLKTIVFKKQLDIIQ
ncbi:MAG: aldehyde dehydrogenase family protein, partial [Treponema sp.]|nr:aldehyde dehydrogenase family protein [Treponema sp.]